MKPSEDWFTQCIDDLSYSPEVKAYVVGVLNRFVASPIVLTSESIVLAYADAKFSGDFAKFQDVGDWVLWSRSVVPTHDLTNVFETIGRQSYATCHQLLRGQWRVYYDLSRNLSNLTHQVHARISPRV